MIRTVLIVGSLDGHFDLLRQIMLETDSTAIRFVAPEHWQDCLNKDQLGALVISASVNKNLCEQIRQDVNCLDSSATIIQLGADNPNTAGRGH